VVVRLARLARAGPLPPVAGRHVGLHPDDRLEPLPAGQLLEGPGAVEAAVVREGQGRHLERLGPADQVPEAVRAVEQ